MELTNTERAAVLLLSLGRESASKIMRHLNETEVKRIARAFTNVSEVGRDTQVKVAREFNKMLKSDERLLVDGRTFVTELLQTAYGDSDSSDMLNFAVGVNKGPIGDIFREVPSKILNAFVTSEHPQTVSFILSQMHPDQASEVLQTLSEEQQTEIILRISHLSNVKSEVVDEVREVLRTTLQISDSSLEEISGPKAAADILNFFDRANEERALGEIEEMYPDLAEEIRNLMFTFEDIGKADDRGIQLILKEVPRDVLVLALKTASAEISDLLLRNVSQRAAGMIIEDLEALGSVKLKDVEKAQQSMVDTVRRLEAEGKITMGGSENEMLV